MSSSLKRFFLRTTEKNMGYTEGKNSLQGQRLVGQRIRKRWSGRARAQRVG